MTYTIIKHPHPLDAIWSQAIEDYSDACSAIEGFPDNFADEQLDAAGAVRTAAILAIMALPARNLADSLFKLDCAGVDSGNIRSDCDPTAILNEAVHIHDEACARGLNGGAS